MKRAVVVLETMWGSPRKRAPRWFRINPYNHSGRKLYQWLAGYDFVVTNACPELVGNARGKGTPDPEWLAGNLRRLQHSRPFDLLLVCGKVAQRTYSPADAGTARILELPHPAFRAWSHAGARLVKQCIAGTGSHRITYANGAFEATQL